MVMVRMSKHVVEDPLAVPVEKIAPPAGRLLLSGLLRHPLFVG
jgi:hypothetical protein